jgi:hypothetical protein
VKALRLLPENELSAEQMWFWDKVRSLFGDTRLVVSAEDGRRWVAVGRADRPLLFLVPDRGPPG